MHHELTLSFAGQQLVMTNQRALYWPSRRRLIVSDLHVGKAAHFRKNGIAMPAGVLDADLNRLQQLIAHYHPQQLLIVGDFLHAGHNSEIQRFLDWKSALPTIEWVLIKGNHDRVPASMWLELGMFETHRSLTDEGILFRHEPSKKPVQPEIAGHLHPGLRLPLPGARNSRFPCFLLRGEQLILPAFSQFTGLNTAKPKAGSIYYFFSKEGIFTQRFD
jgi:DNA ligase-associated metallophosphoesterase